MIGNLLGDERRPRLIYMLSLPNGSTVTGEDEGVVERAWTRDDGFFHAAMREALRLRTDSVVIFAKHPVVTTASALSRA